MHLPQVLSHRHCPSERFGVNRLQKGFGWQRAVRIQGSQLTEAERSEHAWDRRKIQHFSDLRVCGVDGSSRNFGLKNDLNCCMEVCGGGSQEPESQHTIALRMLSGTSILTFALIELGVKMGVSSAVHAPLALCRWRRTVLVMAVEAVTTAAPCARNPGPFSSVP